MEIELLRVKINKLSKQEYAEIKAFEQLIQDKLDQLDYGSPLKDYYLQMSDCSSKIKDYSRD